MVQGRSRAVLARPSREGWKVAFCSSVVALHLPFGVQERCLLQSEASLEGLDVVLPCSGDPLP